MNSGIENNKWLSTPAHRTAFDWQFPCCVDLTPNISMVITSSTVEEKATPSSRMVQSEPWITSALLRKNNQSQYYHTCTSFNSTSLSVNSGWIESSVIVFKIIVLTFGRIRTKERELMVSILFSYFLKLFILGLYLIFLCLAIIWIYAAIDFLSGLYGISNVQ